MRTAQKKETLENRLIKMYLDNPSTKVRTSIRKLLINGKVTGALMGKVTRMMNEFSVAKKYGKNKAVIDKAHLFGYLAKMKDLKQGQDVDISEVMNNYFENYL